MRVCVPEVDAKAPSRRIELEIHQSYKSVCIAVEIRKSAFEACFAKIWNAIDLQVSFHSVAVCIHVFDLAVSSG